MAIWVATAGFALAACPYPLGGALTGGQFTAWGGGADPEWQVVEATQLPGQMGFGLVVEGAGGLHLLYDSEMELLYPSGLEGETHTILYKRWDPRFGWDTPFLSLASDMVLEYTPEGRALQPAAAAVGENVWALWEVSGAQRFRANGSYIALRGIYPDRFGPIMQVAYMDEDNANKIPAITGMGGTAYLGFQTNAAETDRSEFHVAGRTWDGASLGPLEEISRSRDGWSDQTLALASDGERVFAAWASQRVEDLAHQGNWTVKAAVRSAGGSWGPEINVTEARGARADRPSLAWHGGRLYVAWATDDPTLSRHGESVIALAAIDPGATAAGPPIVVYDGGAGGQSYHPTLFSWGERLHVQWSSNRAPPSSPASGTDFDIYYTNYTSGGGFAPPRPTSDPADSEFADVMPGFFTVGDGLYSYFMKNVCRPGCGRETDWREMTRLLERPARWYDGVTARYYLEQPGADAQNFVISYYDGAADPVTSADFAARTWNGSWVFPEANASTMRGSVGANNTTLSLVEGAYCGKLVPTAQVNPPSAAAPAPYGLWAALALGAIALSALAARWGRRGRTLGGPPLKRA